MRLRKTAGAILNILFPARCPRCGRVQGFAPECGCATAWSALRLPPRPLAPRIAAGDACFAPSWACYAYEEPVRGAIHRMKFSGERDLCELLGNDLAVYFAAAGLAGMYDLVVPAPASQKTLRTRGYNQSAVLAGRLAEGAGLACGEGLLRKTRDTTPQMRLDREGRLSNLAGAFEASGQASGARILLVDDIITTGSTLNECARALKKAGAACCGALCVASA